MARALAIIPHPDDESYSFGGTLARLAADGWTCGVVAATNGDQGHRHDGGPTGSEALAAVRRAELAESCRVLGCELLEAWGLPDGALRELSTQAGHVREVLRRFAPHLVLTLGEDGAYGHPDHIAVHRWVREGWEAAGRGPALLFAAFPKGLFVPQYEKCISMMGDPPQPPASAIGDERFDLVADIRGVAAAKLAAIAAHRSQLPGGDPHAIFPPGIVAALLEREWFVAAGDRSREQAAALWPGFEAING
ncbi:MAG: PIG-L deacetylase family protein [Hyphomicrobiales bacterium]